MGISITDLPPKYQAQLLGKVMDQERQKKASKYRNQPTERMSQGGAVLHFDSQKEARRYDQLTQRIKAGHIRDLRLQVDFTLQEAYTDPEGKRVRAIRYKADFTYQEPGNDAETWRLVVEDVKSKGTKTPQYSMKKKLLKERFGIDIVEV